MTTTQQPEALVFADDRPTSTSDDLYQWAIDAEDLIRAQHARIAELEAQLSAIGAGGVEPLRKQAAETSNDILTMADALIIQRTADARDADRYRWLRDNELYVNKELEPVVRLQLNAIWDVKIDEALAAQAKRGKRDMALSKKQRAQLTLER